jgi:hypothetical protein
MTRAAVLVEVALVGGRTRVDVRVRQVVRLHDLRARERLERAVLVRAGATPVLVEELGVLGAEVELRRQEVRRSGPSLGTFFSSNVWTAEKMPAASVSEFVR